MRPRTKQRELGELSQAVRKLREALGQTQQQFAHTLGTAITSIARYETGREPHGRPLARMAQVAADQGLEDLALTFRRALTRELGTWDSTGFTIVGLEPKDDAERLYLSSVLAVLRNPQYADLLPKLNRILQRPARASIEKLDFARRSRQVRNTVLAMMKEAKSAEEIAVEVGASVDDIRQFIAWTHFEQAMSGELERLKSGADE